MQPLPQSVSKVSSLGFTSPQNSPITPASLSDSIAALQEQVQLRNSVLHVFTEAKLPSPCTEDFENDSRLLIVRINN